MKIDIITAVPEILSGPFDTSVIKKGIEKNIVEINIHNLRNYSKKITNLLMTINMGVAQEWFFQLSRLIIV